MPVAVATKGLKRVCVDCGMRFYDFNKRPVTCPGCGTGFSGEFKVRSRRGRVAAAEEEDDTPVLEDKAADAADNIEVVEGEADVVSLEDVEEMDDADDDDDDLDSDDLDMDDDDDEDDFEDSDEDDEDDEDDDDEDEKEDKKPPKGKSKSKVKDSGGKKKKGK